MKRVFPLRTNACALMLALTVAIAAPSYAHAGGKSLWNPLSWFSASASQKADKEARRKAEEASHAADLAMQEAQKAMEKAIDAKRQAEALRTAVALGGTPSKATVTQPDLPNYMESGAAAAEPGKIKLPSPKNSDASKQTVYTASETQAKNSTETADASETATDARAIAGENVASQKTSQESINDKTGKSEPWNPMTWFKNTEESPTTKAFMADETSASSNAKPAATVEQTAASTTKLALAETRAQESSNEDASTKGSAWNPANWFSKSTKTEPAQHTVTEITETNPSKPEDDNKLAHSEPASTDLARSSAKDAEETPASNGKGSAWNPINWLSKPDESASETPANDSAKRQPAKNDSVVKTQAAIIETERGNIAIEFYPDQAPVTVANFKKLVNDGFYNRFNMKFHRVVPGFVVQTGDPTGTGAGGAKENIPLEAKNKLSHNAKGIVAMARGADPNSATSQFYITLTPQTALDGKYAIFGKVIAGLDILEKIEKNDMLYGIKLVDMGTIVKDPPPEKKKLFSNLF